MLSCRFEMPYDICRVFAAYFSDEISWWDFMLLLNRYEMSLWDFVLSAAQFSYEMSCWEFMLIWAVTSFAYEIACLFGRYRYADSCHQHAWHQVDTYVWGCRNVTPEHALVIEGGSLGGLGWWSDVCNLKNVLPSMGCLTILISVLRPSFLARCWLWM